MSDINLRPYQQKFIDDIRLQFRLGHRHVVGVAPCGAGKTIMTGWMIRQSLARGKRSIFFVHRQELIRQTSDTFTRLDIPHGIIAAGVPMHLHLPVQIASVQTLARRLDKISAPDFLICDECHHILANTYKKILDKFPDAFLLGVTATPERIGGITLHDAFDAMVASLSVDELIKLGNLTPFKYFAPSSVDLTGVRSKFGEFVQSDLQNAMSEKKIVGNIVETYQRIIPDKSAIVYCVNVEHSKTVADAFKRAGIAAAHCDGETPAAERDQIVNAFRRGDLKILCNAELFGEGFDVPNMQAVILARPTKSLTLFIQQALRPLRPDSNDPNKVAIIIDHVQNYARHGLPNERHIWSLDENPVVRSAPETKECPKCHAIIPYNARACKHCGNRFEGEKHARDTNEYKGDIVEIDTTATDFTKPETLREEAKRRNYAIGWVAHQAIPYAHSYADFAHIADVCGYKKGWAWYKWQEYKQGSL